MNEPRPDTNRVAPSTILVALDDSPRALEVLAETTLHVAHPGDRLVLLRVVSLPLHAPPEAMAMSPYDVERSFVDAARASLERLAEGVPRSIATTVETRTDGAWRGICAAARERDVDLVVVGSHGHRWVDDVVGTTATAVVRHCDRSVLVVRPRPPRSSEPS